MFSNRFNTPNDPLLGAVEGALKEGALRRQAEALVNEEFGVYSRKAVVREDLAAYDARLEEAYKCMKEGEKKDEKKEDKPKSDYSKMREKMVGKGKDLETTRKIVGEAKKLADKDYDKDGKIETPKDEVWGSRFRAAKMAGKMEEEQIDEVSKKTLGSYIKKAASKKPYTSIHGAAYDAASGDPKARKTIQKREKGIERATDRLTKEETQIDEISRHTLMSYRNKAAKQVMDIKKKGWSTEKDRDTVQKREIGHSLAGDKMRVRVAASYNKGYSPEDLAKHGGRGGAAPKNKMDEEQIDEVSKRAAISAYRGKEGEERDTSKLRRLIKRKWGEKTAKHAERAGARDTGNLVRRGESSGTDRLASAKPSSEMRKTKSGKVHKQDVESKKSEMKFRKSMSKFDKPRGHLPEEHIDEAAYSAKAARAGKDIGKPGKEFKKIAKSAGERYGSEERGKKVAGAILKRIRAKHMKEENLEELSQFGSAFAAARKSGQTQFSFGGKSYSTAMKGQTGTSSAPKPAPTKQPGAPDETSTQSFLKSQGVGVKPPEQRAAPSMSVMDPKATRLTPSAPVSNQSAASGNLPSMATGLAGSTGAKSPTLTPSAPKPTKGFADPGAIENKARATGSLRESVQVGENKYRIV